MLLLLVFSVAQTGQEMYGARVARMWLLCGEHNTNRRNPSWLTVTSWGGGGFPRLKQAVPNQYDRIDGAR